MGPSFPLSLFFPSSPSPSPCLTLPSPPFRSLPLPLRGRSSLNYLAGLGERYKLPQRENEFGALWEAVRKPLVAIILSILMSMFYSRSIKI